MSNYFSKAFGHLNPQHIDNAEFRREFDNWLFDIRSYRNDGKKLSKDPENPRGVIDRDSLSKMFSKHHGDLIRIWGSSMWACVMLILYDTGMRQGEVRALTWQNIDIRKRFVPIRKGIEAGTTKTVKGTKTGVVKAGFLNERSVQELDIYRVESRWRDNSNFVFTINGKSPVTILETGQDFQKPEGQ